MLKMFSSTERLKNKTLKHLEMYSRPNLDFFLLTAFASAIISFGLILDNSSIIIGGMVVAPLITPFFGLSISLILLRIKETFETIGSIILGIFVAVVISFIIGYITNLAFIGTFDNTTEILSRTKPDVLYFIVAVLSGLIGSYAYVRPTLSERIVGIAISAAIVPPLAVVGLSLAKMDIKMITSSSILFLINFLGICLGSILMFIILGFGKEKESKL
ncbi:MAG: hypothetical protein ACD_18C00112G0003 [uncultured bacterium]|nr:MAG: hypothetical protein ACD_18C00112G0003 [uncultured bacterium]OGH84489.1 MAG: TIGR00341 family protein [Candidatus Magasanikbacteria bacterium RIFOXYC12_FULL_32_21b]OGH91259.1 MAG: TIGR00341 family protein [Candidatus Magasanikbacteria bacterium RIFOXYD12_FULL_33_17]HAO52508.1 TIGR00341 family protein [Candidatus Magasanikbacteria bacterium]